MRRLLGVLREDQDGNELTPQPGLAQLDALVERARGAGVEVSARRRPASRASSPPASTSPPTGSSRRRSPTSQARRAARPPTVALEWERRRSCGCTCNDRGPGANGTAPGDGHGLVGMRERVKVHGGELRAGTRDEGGFEVHATLPLP